MRCILTPLIPETKTELIGFRRNLLIAKLRGMVSEGGAIEYHLFVGKHGSLYGGYETPARN